MGSLHSPSSSDKSGNEDAARFLDAFMLGAPADACLLLWELAGKRSRWFRVADRDAIALYVTDRVQPGVGDTYLGAALSPKDYGPGRRCPADQAIGIVGVWADIDIAGPAHKKANLPQTIEEARELSGALGIVPTITVHSGHGLQCWWLLESPWIFRDEDGRLRAQDLVLRFQAALRRNAESRGWSLDSTHDLPRVMRLPGTWNCKRDPVQVRILEINPTARYSLSDFAALLAEEPARICTVGANGRSYNYGTESVIERALAVYRQDAGGCQRLQWTRCGRRRCSRPDGWYVVSQRCRIEQARPLLLEYSAGDARRRGRRRRSSTNSNRQTSRAGRLPLRLHQSTGRGAVGRPDLHDGGSLQWRRETETDMRPTRRTASPTKRRRTGPTKPTWATPAESSGGTATTCAMSTPGSPGTSGTGSAGLRTRREKPSGG